MFCLSSVRKSSPKEKTFHKRKAQRYSTFLKNSPSLNACSWSIFAERVWKMELDTSQGEDLFLHLLSAIGLHTWPVSRAGDSLLVSVMLLTLFPKSHSDIIFYHQKQNKSSTKLDMRNSSQSKLAWAIRSKWFYLIKMAFFSLVVNYLWTDYDCTNKLADYSKKFYILRHYFKLKPLASYSLAIHINYSHCNWHFLSVLLKHHLMWLCEIFHSGSFLWIYIHCNILCVNFY